MNIRKKFNINTDYKLLLCQNQVTLNKVIIFYVKQPQLLNLLIF